MLYHCACWVHILTFWSRRGGEEVLLDVGGQDATEAFEDVGHSDEAREILQGLLVGNLKRQVRRDVLSRVPIYLPRCCTTIFESTGILMDLSADYHIAR